MKYLIKMKYTWWKGLSSSLCQNLLLIIKHFTNTISPWIVWIQIVGFNDNTINQLLDPKIFLAKARILTHILLRIQIVQFQIPCVIYFWQKYLRTIPLKIFLKFRIRRMIIVVIQKRYIVSIRVRDGDPVQLISFT